MESISGNSERIAMSKRSKWLCIIACALLIFMALFHGSGYFYVKDLIQTSDAPNFLKEIVPALFAHPSFHLIGLAAFGILSLYLGVAGKKVRILIGILVMMDAILGFILGGLVPGLLLSTAALLFFIAGRKG